MLTFPELILRSKRAARNDMHSQISDAQMINKPVFFAQLFTYPFRKLLAPRETEACIDITHLQAEQDEIGVAGVISQEIPLDREVQGSKICRPIPLREQADSLDLADPLFKSRRVDRILPFSNSLCKIETENSFLDYDLTSSHRGERARISQCATAFPWMCVKYKTSERELRRC